MSERGVHMVIRLRLNIIIASALICAVLISACGYNAIQASSKLSAVRLPVVMYHQLTEDESKAGKYVLPISCFEKDLKYLKENGYHSVTVKELLDFAEGREDLPEKSVMITFDDGCETLHTYAEPLLEKYGFTAVGFIVGSLADYYSEIDDHNLSYSNLNWSAIKEMAQRNTVEIQSHSYDAHKNESGRSGLKKKKSETIEQYSEFLGTDAAKMKTAMLENAGYAPVAIAYPFGSYSKESADILKKYGIRLAFTCEEKVNIIRKADSEWLFGIGRYNRPSGISSEAFFEKWE